MSEAFSRRSLFTRRIRPLRTAVRKAIAQADPIRLLELGAPGDEYEPEVDAIMARLDQAKTFDQVRVIIHSEFSKKFGEDIAGPPDKYRDAAVAIWDAMKGER